MSELTPKAAFLKEMKAEEGIAAQLRELNGQFDRLRAMRVADYFLTPFEKIPELDALQFMVAYEKYDDGYVLTACGASQKIVGVAHWEHEGPVVRKALEGLRAMNLNAFYEPITIRYGNAEGRWISLTREVAQHLGFDRERVAAHLGLIDAPAPAIALATSPPDRARRARP